MMAAVVFTVAFIIYIVTLSPTISVGDSPELISSAFTLGIGHPPGYPLFSLLGKLASVIPSGNSIAYRVNLLSAFLAALSVLFLYLTIIEAIGLIRRSSEGDRSKLPPTPSLIKEGEPLGGGVIHRTGITADLSDHLSALLGSLAFALSNEFWSQAVIGEVYTLNAAFFTCLLWLSLKWFSVGAGLKPAPTFQITRLLYLIAFLWGLSLSNHHTMIAFGPFFLLFVLWNAWNARVSKETEIPASPIHPLAVSLLFLLLGLSVYLYLPIRSSQNPFMDWGDPEKLGRFLDVLLRRQFGLGSRDYSMERGLMQSGYYLSLLREQFTLPVLILGGAGAVLFARRCFVTFLFTFALFMIFGVFTILILNPAPPDFYSMDVMVIPSLAVFSAFIGIGFLLAYSSVISVFTKNLTTERENKVCLVLTPIFILLPLTLFSINFKANNQSSNTFAYDYAYDVTESVDPNGVLFVDTDLSLFPIWYLQYVEGMRKDVAVLNVDMLMLPWFKDQLKGKYPTVEIKVPDIIKHTTGGKFKPLSSEALENYKASQVEGMLDTLMDAHSVYLSYEFGIPFKEFGERRDIGLVRNGVIFRVSKEKLSDKPVGDFHGLRSIVKAIGSRDEEVLFIGRAYIPAMEKKVSLELASGRKDRAMEIMDAILIVDPYNADSLNSLAFLYADEHKNLYKAEQMVKRALKINPVERGRYLKTLGFIYLKKGEYGKAIEIFKEVLKIEPGSEWIRSRLEEAEKGGNL